MKGDYFIYIAAAYAVCFLVLGLVTVSSILEWQRVKKELGE